ncbi:ion channel [Fructilactobacillus vespulae]|uniref:ion channel n=1 Tax=Fructilactobacillus vespulae TaxID=1249630 RepID=UPI0039B417AA
MKTLKRDLKDTYNGLIIFLAIVSVILVILDLLHAIAIEDEPYLAIDTTITLIFAIDYFGGFYYSTNKKQYFKTHIFDLLAIIPFGLFSAFKIIRMSKLFKLFRIVGVFGKLINKTKKFLETNGFIYLLITCTFIIFIGGITYSIAEKASFGDSIWWAITTSTTVGYGDQSPHTTVGKVIAVVLMMVGISFVGMLTSTITSFYERQNQNTNADELKKFYELYQSGAITKSEYEQQKDKLLQ